MKTWLSIAVAGMVLLTLTLILERRHVSTLRAQNESLASEVGKLNAMSAENVRLSNLLAELKRDNTSSNSNFRELIKLRGDVGLLRQEVSRLESASKLGGTVSGTQRDPEVSLALGRSKLRYAEEILKEAEMKFAVGVTTSFELERARFEHDMVQAELQGDSGRVGQLKAEMAEKNFVLAEAKAKVGVISNEELERVKLERDLAIAELNPNAAEITRIKLEAAEAQFKAYTARRQAGVVSATELLRIELERDVAAAEYASAIKHAK